MANLIENRKAFHDYEILEKFEAGIELTGSEVKSLRKHQGSLKGTYVGIRGGEAYLVGMNIPPYQPANTNPSYDPARSRRLLLSKKELLKLAETEHQKGLTLVPISVYNKKRFLKIEIGIGRGKKKYDKREDLKRREHDREIGRTLKRE